MFFEKYECDIASYAHDNTPRAHMTLDLYTVLSKLKNCDKCHLLVTTLKLKTI